MKIKIRFFLALAIIAGLVLSAFSTLCYIEYVDPVTLFVTPAVTVNIFYVCCSAAVILLFLMPRLIIGRCDVSEAVPNNSFVIFSSSLLGFLFAGYFVNFLLAPLKKYVTAELPRADVSSFGGIIKGMYIAGLILAIPCAVYFILIALRKNLDRSAGMCILSISPVLFMCVKLIYTFMDTSSRVNIAGRRITIVAFCLCIVFFLSEASLCVPIRNAEKEKNDTAKASARYLMSGIAAITALFVSQLSTTLLQAFWLISPGDTYIMNGIFITMILYITARIMSLSPRKV